MIARHLIAAAVALGARSLGAAQRSPAHALSMSECSAKSQAATTAGTLNGMKWNEYRKAHCGADASAAPAAAPAAAPLPLEADTGGAPAPKPAPAAAPASEPVANPLKPLLPGAAPAAAGSPVFPSAVSPKFSSETAGKRRFHTCLEQYNANKANGSLKCRAEVDSEGRRLLQRVQQAPEGHRLRPGQNANRADPAGERLRGVLAEGRIRIIARG